MEWSVLLFVTFLVYLRKSKHRSCGATAAWAVTRPHVTIIAGPTMTNLYDSPVEATAHEEAIASLIEETRLPPDVVRRVYEREFVQLKPAARVKDYLLLFTLRKAREALRSAHR
jgi:uncharacterized protein DUF3562